MRFGAFDFFVAAVFDDFFAATPLADFDAEAAFTAVEPLEEDDEPGTRAMSPRDHT
jgi:hypothetical protein